MLEYHFYPFSTALSCADFFLVAGGIVVLGLVVEDKTNQPRVHLIAEAQGVTDVDELFNEGTAFTQSSFRGLQLHLGSKLFFPTNHLYFFLVLHLLLTAKHPTLLGICPVLP